MNVIFIAMTSGIYMALWVYGESRLASQLGIGREAGLLAGMIVSIWILMRLQGIIVASRRVKSVRWRRTVYLLSPLIFYVSLYFIDWDMLVTSLMGFSIMTIYMGLVTAVSVSTIYHEMDYAEWPHAVSMYRSSTTLVQAASLLLASLWLGEDRIWILLVIATLSAIASVTLMKGYIISSMSFKVLDNFSDLVAFTRYNVRQFSYKTLLKYAGVIGGLASVKLVNLPAATAQNPFNGLITYSLGYLIGARLAINRYEASLAVFLGILAMAYPLLNLNPLITIAVIGLGLGFTEVSATLYILDTKPRMMLKATIVLTAWTILGALATGITSMAIPRNASLSGLIVALISIILSRIGR
ncbi:MAG: hypothetical protein GSR85_08955 [Desulfurococcales archaeon]|nr:hypothetical protein [Desulfurococcales archaeon]